MRSIPGNLYDGHTPAETQELVCILADTERPPHTAIVDRGHRGVEVEGVRTLRSGQRRGITKALKAMIKRRSAIEPVIGNMKMDGRLGPNPLKGAPGNGLHAVMCGAGHNPRLILAALRLNCACFEPAVQALIDALLAASDEYLPVDGRGRSFSGRTNQSLYNRFASTFFPPMREVGFYPFSLIIYPPHHNANGVAYFFNDFGMLLSKFLNYYLGRLLLVEPILARTKLFYRFGFECIRWVSPLSVYALRYFREFTDYPVYIDFVIWVYGV